MATVEVEVNGHRYSIGCADGQENHLKALAGTFDVSVRNIADQVGAVGELRLILMAALVQADELAEARDRARRFQAETMRAHEALTRAETRAAAALDAAARRVEDISQKLG